MKQPPYAAEEKSLLTFKQIVGMKLALWCVFLQQSVKNVWRTSPKKQPEKKKTQVFRLPEKGKPRFTRIVFSNTSHSSQPLLQEVVLDKTQRWKMKLALHWLGITQSPRYQTPAPPPSKKPNPMSHTPVKQLHNTSFWESLMIQKRVIGALLMREIITRYGRANIGFLWLFIEPLAMTAMIVAMWKFMRADQYSSLNIVAFALTGYPMVMMWRNASNRVIGAISANQNLLYHRNVRVLDTIFARMLLEVAGATIAQIGITIVLILIGWIPYPADVFYMLLAWIQMSIFAFALGLIICSIAFKFEVFGKIWGTVSFVLMPISGTLFFVHTLPQQARDLMLKIPMVHGTEMFRHGYFGASAITHENPYYLLLSNLILLWLGLVLVNNFSKGVEPE